MRRINAENYAILFIVEESTGLIRIVRILYGRMDLESVLAKNDQEPGC